MKKTEDDFDESILDNEAEFNNRFKRIDCPQRPNFAINKALKEAKNRITIYLDADIVEHFKKEAEKSKTGYQTLINQTLREKIDGSRTKTGADEIIEKLLQDKTALSRLKAELETV
ncbi:MAG TPA: BrnA antitoxin family protein [Pyrinomonadaceae bacterium]|nr:BrnA antitoxin family protein [Pyrinomonadaceae bacterium]